VAFSAPLPVRAPFDAFPPVARREEDFPRVAWLEAVLDRDVPPDVAFDLVVPPDLDLDPEARPDVGLDPDDDARGDVELDPDVSPELVFERELPRVPRPRLLPLRDPDDALAPFDDERRFDAARLDVPRSLSTAIFTSLSEKRRLPTRFPWLATVPETGKCLFGATRRFLGLHKCNRAPLLAGGAPVPDGFRAQLCPTGASHRQPAGDE
jgi:hypothetical protein